MNGSSQAGDSEKEGIIQLNYADGLAGFLRVFKQHKRQAGGEAKMMPGFWLCSWWDNDGLS